MNTRLAEVVEYSMELPDGNTLDLNDYIGGRLKIESKGEIHCVFCGCLTPKSYGGGSCYRCLQSLPQNDMCQVKPELCHIANGTCRDSSWGEAHCMQPHRVYLARSSGIKVGITRENPTETRWMDQGAVEGMVIAEVPDRRTSGLVETALARHIDDKTDFRKMLRGEIVEGDLMEFYENVVDHVPMAYQTHLVDDPQPVKIDYPLADHPEKVKPMSLDKAPVVEGQLVGIKGQYLVFEDFVFNVRAHSGYDVVMEGEKGPGFQASEEKDEGPMDLFDLMG